jgi:hypothetical protein
VEKSSKCKLSLVYVNKDNNSNYNLCGKKLFPCPSLEMGFNNVIAEGVGTIMLSEGKYNSSEAIKVSSSVILNGSLNYKTLLCTFFFMVNVDTTKCLFEVLSGGELTVNKVRLIYEPSQVEYNGPMFITSKPTSRLNIVSCFFEVGENEGKKYNLFKPFVQGTSGSVRLESSFFNDLGLESSLVVMENGDVVFESIEFKGTKVNNNMLFIIPCVNVSNSVVVIENCIFKDFELNNSLLILFQNVSLKIHHCTIENFTTSHSLICMSYLKKVETKIFFDDVNVSNVVRYSDKDEINGTILYVTDQVENILISACCFVNISKGKFGGALCLNVTYVNESSSSVIQSTTFRNCTAEYGGAFYLNSTAIPLVSSRFEVNFGSSGNDIYISSESINYDITNVRSSCSSSSKPQIVVDKDTLIYESLLSTWCDTGSYCIGEKEDTTKCSEGYWYKSIKQIIEELNFVKIYIVDEQHLEESGLSIDKSIVVSSFNDILRNISVGNISPSGFFIEVKNGDVNFNKCNFIICKDMIFFYLKSSTFFDLENCQVSISPSTSLNFPFIRQERGVVTYIYNVSFQNISVQESCIFFLENSGGFTLFDCMFSTIKSSVGVDRSILYAVSSEILNITFASVNLINCSSKLVNVVGSGIMMHIEDGTIQNVSEHYKMTLLNEESITGGGYLNGDGGKYDVKNAQFSNLSVNGDGGVFVFQNSVISISDCDFLYCHSTNYGGAVFFGTNTVFSIKSVKFSFCQAINGGAIGIDSMRMESRIFSNVVFSNNSAENMGADIADVSVFPLVFYGKKTFEGSVSVEDEQHSTKIYFKSIDADFSCLILFEPCFYEIFVGIEGVTAPSCDNPTCQTSSENCLCNLPTCGSPTLPCKSISIGLKLCHEHLTIHLMDGGPYNEGGECISGSRNVSVVGTALKPKIIQFKDKSFLFSVDDNSTFTLKEVCVQSSLDSLVVVKVNQNSTLHLIETVVTFVGSGLLESPLLISSSENTTLTIHNTEMLDIYTKQSVILGKWRKIRMFNSTFKNITAESSRGGLISFDQGESIEFVVYGSLFDSVSDCGVSGMGGAIYFKFESKQGSLCICIINLTSFYNCSLPGRDSTCGGAVVIESSEEVLVADCAFIGCSNVTQGGGAYLSGTPLVVKDCLFYECSARVFGGGLFVYGNQSNDAEIHGCSFLQCISTNRGGGGLCCLTGGKVNLSFCEFINCTVEKYDFIFYFFILCILARQ